MLCDLNVHQKIPVQCKLNDWCPYSSCHCTKCLRSVHALVNLLQFILRHNCSLFSLYNFRGKLESIKGHVTFSYSCVWLDASVYDWYKCCRIPWLGWVRVCLWRHRPRYTCVLQPTVTAPSRDHFRQISTQFNIILNVFQKLNSCVNMNIRFLEMLMASWTKKQQISISILLWLS